MRNLIAVCLALALGIAIFLSSYWWIFLIAGVLVLAMSFAVPNVGHVSSQQILSPPRRSSMTRLEFEMPQEWNPTKIRAQAQKTSSDLSVKAFALSFWEQFVLDQNVETARKRIAFLKTIFDEMKVSLDIKNLGVEAGLWEGTDLQELARKRDVLKLQVEIAQLEQQQTETRNPPIRETPRPPQVARSAAEVRKEKREEILADIRGYEETKKKIAADKGLTEDSKRRQENMIESKIETLHNELEKYI